jgi:hypothetical protein
VYESLVTGVPDFPMMRISATCPINERSSFRREIADRDSVEQDLYAFENSDSPISDSLRNLLTRVHLGILRLRSILGISRITGSRFS